MKQIIFILCKTNSITAPPPPPPPTIPPWLFPPRIIPTKSHTSGVSPTLFYLTLRNDPEIPRFLSNPTLFPKYSIKSNLFFLLKNTTFSQFRPKYL